jgi:hypothetical protein
LPPYFFPKLPVRPRRTPMNRRNATTQQSAKSGSCKAASHPRAKHRRKCAGRPTSKRSRCAPPAWLRRGRREQQEKPPPAWPQPAGRRSDPRPWYPILAQVKIMALSPAAPRQSRLIQRMPPAIPSISEGPMVAFGALRTASAAVREIPRAFRRCRLHR